MLLLFLHPGHLSARERLKPKLVVGIVVDQMRGDYLNRFWGKIGDGGFKRLVNQGYSFENAHYNYVPTYTAPGHASIYTGTYPSVHGIVGNVWYNRFTGKEVYCTSDDSVASVGGGSVAGKMSPRNMLSTTITDELRIASNRRAKVIGIAFKDRSAILPAGHLADGAYWFDGRSGSFITSTFYMNRLPDWVDNFNKRNLAKFYTDRPWNTLLSIENYVESLPDDSPYEMLFGDETKPVFPHNLPKLAEKYGLSLLGFTPFGNSLTKDFVLEALRAEKLGMGSETDFLAVSFSSTDYIGHAYGPRSVEVEDSYLRLDLDIAEILNALDVQLGKDNYVVFLTSDHGAAEVPAFLRDLKIPAGYFDQENATKGLKENLFAVYGDSLVEKYINQQVYLDHRTISTKKLNLREVQETAAAYLRSLDGVSSALTGYALQYHGFFDHERNNILNGYSHKRSGDVVLNLEPAWTEPMQKGTTHGSTYSYDTWVPMIWYGWKIPTGRSYKRVNITDIAPTLSRMLEIAYPNGTTGQPLVELMVDH